LTSRSGYKGISANPVAKLVCRKNLPLSLRASVFIPLKFVFGGFSRPFKYPETLGQYTGSDTASKKKSEIMRSIVKNRKQGSNLPISIKLVVKIVAVVLGCSLWGTGFVWALVGLYLFLPVIRGILSFFVGLGAIILFILILFSFL